MLVQTLWALFVILGVERHSVSSSTPASAAIYLNATTSANSMVHRRLRNKGGTGAYLGLTSSSWMKPEQYSPSHHRAKADEDNAGGMQRVAVILYGRSASASVGSIMGGDRDNECRPADQAKQLEVAATQQERMLRLLKHKGFNADLFIATNNVCGEEWANKLISAYRPFITAARFDNCDDGADADDDNQHGESGSEGAKGRLRPLTSANNACHLKHGLALFDRSEHTTKSGMGSFLMTEGGGGARTAKHKAAYSTVLLVRTDLRVLGQAGGKMMVSLATLGREAVTFPHRCEVSAWEDWQCGSDTAIALPGKAFEAFRHTCLFKTSCFAFPSSSRSSSQSSSGSHLFLGEGFDLRSSGRAASSSSSSVAYLVGPSAHLLTPADKAGYSRLATSGRGCYRCAALSAHRAHPQGNAGLAGAPVGFVSNALVNVNVAPTQGAGRGFQGLSAATATNSTLFFRSGDQGLVVPGDDLGFAPTRHHHPHHPPTQHNHHQQQHHHQQHSTPITTKHVEMPTQLQLQLKQAHERAVQEQTPSKGKKPQHHGISLSALPGPAEKVSGKGSKHHMIERGKVGTYGDGSDASPPSFDGMPNDVTARRRPNFPGAVAGAKRQALREKRQAMRLGLGPRGSIRSGSENNEEGAGLEFSADVPLLRDRRIEASPTRNRE